MLASIRQGPSMVHYEVAERLLLNRVKKKPAQDLPEIDDLVLMATKIKQKALSSLSKEVTKITKYFKLKSKSNNLRLKILPKLLRTGKTIMFLKMKGPVDLPQL